MGGYAALAARQLAGWRGLAIFWAVVLALLGGNLVGIALIVWVRRRRRRDG